MVLYLDCCVICLIRSRNVRVEIINAIIGTLTTTKFSLQELQSVSVHVFLQVLLYRFKQAIPNVGLPKKKGVVIYTPYLFIFYMNALHFFSYSNTFMGHFLTKNKKCSAFIKLGVVLFSFTININWMILFLKIKYSTENFFPKKMSSLPHL